MEGSRYIVTRRDDIKCFILKSVSFGRGGWHMKTKWIDMEDSGEYPAAFFTSSEDGAKTIAKLVGGDVISVPAHLVCVNS